MAKRISDMNTLGTPDNSDYMEVLDSSEILPNNSNKKMTLLTLKNWVLSAFNLPQHKNTHVVGGTDAFLPTDLLDAIARFRVKLGNVLTGERRGVNFIPGSNVTITTLDDVLNDQVNVTINATNNGGDVTNGNNLGGQNEVFVSKTAGILNYRTIEGTGATSVSTVGNVIQINTPASTGEANTMSNVGTGLGNVFRDKVGVNFNLKTINAGTNIQVVNNPDDITINTTARNNQGVNVGGAVEVYAGMSGDNLQFRTLQGTGSITVSQAGNNVVINSNVLAPNIVNVGTGQGVFKNVIGNTYNFKSIRSLNSGIIITSNADEILLQNEYSFNDRWLSNIATNKLMPTFLQSPVHSTIQTAAIVGTGGLILSLTSDVSLNGNFNIVTCTGSIDILNSSGVVTLINYRFVNTNFINEAIMTITSGLIYFKDCVFYNNVVNNAADIILNGNANVVFENCYFVGLSSATRTVEHIQFDNFTGSCVFKNCVIGANYTTAYTYCMTSNTPINVQLLGSNYAKVTQDPNITFTVETLNVDTNLIYTNIAT